MGNVKFHQRFREITSNGERIPEQQHPGKALQNIRKWKPPRTWSPCHAWTLWSLPCWRGLRFTVTMSPTSSYHSPSHSAVTSSSASSELSGRVKIVICPLPRWVAWIKGTPRIQNRQVVKVKNSRIFKIFRNNLAMVWIGVPQKVFSCAHLLAVPKVRFGGSRSLRICYTNRSQNDVMFDKPFKFAPPPIYTLNRVGEGSRYFAQILIVGEVG